MKFPREWATWSAMMAVGTALVFSMGPSGDEQERVEGQLRQRHLAGNAGAATQRREQTQRFKEVLLLQQKPEPPSASEVKQKPGPESANA